MNRPRSWTGTASRHIEAPADAVFAVITDLGHLPAWNQRMTGVVELPERLEPGAEWEVGFRLLGSGFSSRSTVVAIDRSRRRFAYRSRKVCPNPSYTCWTWEVAPEGDGCRVTLGWDLRPLTPSRRLLATPMRAWQIPRTDAPASLAALADRCERKATCDAPNPAV